MCPYHALITDGLEKEGIEILENAGIAVNNSRLSAEQILNQIADYDALIVRSSTKVTKDVIDAAKRLKLIGRPGIGVDNIDVEYASKMGIVVKNAPAGIVLSTAEITIGFVYSLARNIPQACSSIREGRWEKKKYIGVTISGRTMGIVGYGKVGNELGRLAKSNGMNVLAHDINPNPSSSVKYVTKEKLLEKSDFVSVNTPKLREPIIGERELEIMRKRREEKGRRTYLINTSRAENVDHDALYKALKEGWIDGAASDVHIGEPTSDGPFKSRLCELANFIPTPHLGASTLEAQKSAGIEITKVAIGYLLYGNVNSTINLRYQRTINNVNAHGTCPYCIVPIVHDDRKGVFKEITAVFSRNGISIPSVPSYQFAFEDKDLSAYHLTPILSSEHVSEKLIEELMAIDGVYRAFA